MELFSTHTKDTNYALRASMKDGALQLEGHDLSPGLEAFSGRDEYECWYTVAAADVPRVEAALLDEAETARPDARTDAETRRRAHGADAVLFELLRQRFAVPHGISASTAFREWLVAHAIPYEFSSY
jgi:hypothetical protein